MENIKIGVVVVTFNRKKLLSKSLEGILSQTYPVDSIFVIDNNSNDGTDEIFKEKFNNPKIKYLKLDKNLGSAGGFKNGAQLAYEAGVDWVWFLDDDVVPLNDCLEVLLKYKNISKCIHPNKIDIENNEFIWESVYDPFMAKASFLNNLSFKNGKDFVFMNMGCFEGMLIKRDIIEKIGLPDERFFICSDDTIYGFLASFYTNVLLVRDAKLEKQFVFNNTPKPVFFYYFLRNQFLIKKYLQELGLYKGLFFYLNIAIILLSASTKHFIKSKSFKVVIYSFRGLFDGLRGVFYEKK